LTKEQKLLHNNFMEDNMIKEYLKICFRNDLYKMNLKQPECMTTCNSNDCIRHLDKNTLYFGDNGWSNIENDIKNIDKENYKYFFICLFIIIVIDMGMYTYYKDYYRIFRKKTMYPKFGCIGFGFSFGNPYKILSVPETLNLININDVSNEMDEIVEIFINSCKDFLEKNIPDISPKIFIEKIINDRDMQSDSDILRLFRRKILEKNK
jgi:hypothetical protein